MTYCDIFLLQGVYIKPLETRQLMLLESQALLKEPLQCMQIGQLCCHLIVEYFIKEHASWLHLYYNPYNPVKNQTSPSNF